MSATKYAVKLWQPIDNSKLESILKIIDHPLVREKILDELIQIDTWDWWKAQVFYLRERKEYAEAEAVFNEFKINENN